MKIKKQKISAGHYKVGDCEIRRTETRIGGDWAWCIKDQNGLIGYTGRLTNAIDWAIRLTEQRKDAATLETVNEFIKGWVK